MMPCGLSRMSPGASSGMMAAMYADTGSSGGFRVGTHARIQVESAGSLAKARLPSTPVTAGLSAAGCTAAGHGLSAPVSPSRVRNIRVRRIRGRGRNAVLGVMPERLPGREVTLAESPVERLM
jgi:hypothetical protein